MCLALFYVAHYIILLKQYISIKPLGDKVLVKIKTTVEKTTGGTLLPTTTQSKPQGGEVVAIGKGKTIRKNKVDVGVHVYAQVNLPLHFRYFSATITNFVIFCFFLLVRRERKLYTPNMLEQKLSLMDQIIFY